VAWERDRGTREQVEGKKLAKGEGGTQRREGGKDKIGGGESDGVQIPVSISRQMPHQ
jgi:hypothetical protein